MHPMILLTGWKTGTQWGDSPDICVRRNYGMALSQEGAAPVMALTGDPEEYARRFDGILFTGGVDLDPALYGESVLPSCGSIDRDRDREELRLFDAFLRAGKPMLGICRGIQTINVALGGSLWQNLPSQKGSHIPTADAPLTHVLRPVPGSMAALCGETLRVNSFHHQAVKEPGRGLRITAVSESDVVEAVEHETLPIYGFQWHPERCIGSENCGLTDMRPLFRRFVQRCGGR